VNEIISPAWGVFILAHLIRIVKGIQSFPTNLIRKTNRGHSHEKKSPESASIILSGRRAAAVTEMNDKEAELERILRHFAGFIRLHLHKFAPNRFGLDSEDLYQEIRIKIWKVLTAEKEIKCLASYVRKIIDSTVIDQLRKIKREENVYNYELERKTSELKSVYSPVSSRGKELKDLVARAADSLIDSRRRVVKLYLSNMSIEEIADSYQWSRDKTRNLLYRGLSDLKKIIHNWTKADAD